MCMQYQRAIPPKTVEALLRSSHPRVSVEQRRACKEAVCTLLDVSWEPTELRLPTPKTQRIPGLREREDRLTCQSAGCWYTCTTQTGIITHCKNKHQWQNRQKRGGNARKKTRLPPNSMWDEGQAYQEIFKQRSWPAYIAVPQQEESGRAAVGLAESMAGRQRLQKEDAANPERNIIKEGSRTETNPWVTLSQWIPHLQGSDFRRLTDARRMPESEPENPAADERDDDEKALALACKSATRVVEKAFAICTPDKAGRLALEAIETRETGAQSNEKPFSLSDITSSRT